MKFNELEKNWNELGRVDPYWAILSDPAKKGGKWDEREFFEHGTRFINRLMKELDELAPDLRRRKALDFGCGAGRLTQALCHYFEDCRGIDIAESMIELANKHNRYGKRCIYHLNKKDDLSLFRENEFDFILSIIVLQHMKPEYSKKYINEFIRLLAPGGMAVFQLPAAVKPEFVAPPPSIFKKVAHAATAFIKRIQKNSSVEPAIEMYGVPREEVLRLVEKNCRIISVQSNSYAGKEWESYTYFIQKQGGP